MLTSPGTGTWRPAATPDARVAEGDLLGTLTDWFGIEMIPVPLHEDGPDADVVAELVASDPAIKGIWVVPTYANPSGAVTSEARVRPELRLYHQVQRDYEKTVRERRRNQTANYSQRGRSVSQAGSSRYQPR